jgi:hypothetical protein
LNVLSTILEVGYEENENIIKQKNQNSSHSNADKLVEETNR